MLTSSKCSLGQDSVVARLEEVARLERLARAGGHSFSAHTAYVAQTARALAWMGVSRPAEVDTLTKYQIPSFFLNIKQHLIARSTRTYSS